VPAWCSGRAAGRRPFPPSTALPAGSRRSAPTWEASSAGMMRRNPGTALCTAPASLPQGRSCKDRPQRISRPWSRARLLVAAPDGGCSTVPSGRLGRADNRWKIRCGSG
jgi:hypothetical protein